MLQIQNMMFTSNLPNNLDEFFRASYDLPDVCVHLGHMPVLCFQYFFGDAIHWKQL